MDAASAILLKYLAGKEYSHLLLDAARRSIQDLIRKQREQFADGSTDERLLFSYVVLQHGGWQRLLRK